MNGVDERLQVIQDAWSVHLRRGQSDPSVKPNQRDYIYASQRRRCVRAMALDLIHPEELQPYREPFPDDALERMRTGNERENDICARLIAAGKYGDPPFTVKQQQTRFEIKDRDGTILIVGKIDGMIQFADREDVPFEVKSGDSFRRIRDLADFDRSIWTWNKPDQLLSYLYGLNAPWGIFVLDAPGLPTMIPVELEDHLLRMESFLEEARQAVDARFGRGDLPPFYPDNNECTRCPHFERSCTPPEIDFGEGVKVITPTDTDLEMLEAFTGNEDAAKAYDRAKRHLSKRLRGVELGLIGPYKVTGKWGKSTKYDVPPDIKDQYKTVDPKGRFSWNLEPLEDVGDET